MSSYSENLDKVINGLESAKTSITEEFGDMDFENCSLYYDMEELVDLIITKYDNVIALCEEKKASIADALSASY